MIRIGDKIYNIPLYIGDGENQIVPGTQDSHNACVEI